MFILLRKVGEHVLINHEIKCKVLEISKAHVKLGIQAPSHITVERGEVAQKNNKDTKHNQDDNLND